MGLVQMKIQIKFSRHFNIHFKTNNNFVYSLARYINDINKKGVLLIFLVIFYLTFPSFM